MSFLRDYLNLTGSVSCDSLGLAPIMPFNSSSLFFACAFLGGRLLKSVLDLKISPRLCSAFRCLQRTGSLLCKEILHPRFQIVPPMYYVSHQQHLYCTPSFCWNVIIIVAVGSLDTRYLSEPKATIIHRTTPESPLSFGCLGS